MRPLASSMTRAFLVAAHSTSAQVDSNPRTEVCQMPVVARNGHCRQRLAVVSIAIALVVVASLEGKRKPDANPFVSFMVSHEAGIPQIPLSFLASVTFSQRVRELIAQVPAPQRILTRPSWLVLGRGPSTPAVVSFGFMAIVVCVAASVYYLLQGDRGETLLYSLAGISIMVLLLLFASRGKRGHGS